MLPSKNHVENETSRIGPETPIWGFEGCGIMWNFYLDESEAREKAGNSALIEITLKEGHDLDNIRRQEMGFERISLHAFKRILLDDIFPSET